MKKIETYLPLFPGFYGTIFEADNEDSEIDDINEQRVDKGLPEITYDDCEWNYAEYTQEISESAVNFVDGVFKEMDMGLKFNFQALSSPREYNFSNDSINVEVEVSDMNKIVTYLQEYKEEFADYIKDRYTSCDGFWSHHSNDSIDWLFAINNDEKLDHKLGSILNFILLNEDQTQMDMYESCQEDGSTSVYATNYSELIGDDQAK